MPTKFYNLVNDLNGNSEISAPSQKAVKTYITNLDSTLVHLDGAETIVGNKTFAGSVYLNGSNTVNGPIETRGTFIASGYTTLPKDAVLAETPHITASQTDQNIATIGWANTPNGSNILHLNGKETVVDIKSFNTNTLRVGANMSASSTVTSNEEQIYMFANTSATNASDPNAFADPDGLNIIRKIEVDEDGKWKRRWVEYRSGWRKTDNSTNIWPGLKLGSTADDNSFGEIFASTFSFTGPMPAITDSSDKVATTAWVSQKVAKDLDNKFVDLTTDQSINGKKTFNDTLQIITNVSNYPLKIKSNAMDLINVPTNAILNGIGILDKNNLEAGAISTVQLGNGSLSTFIAVHNPKEQETVERISINYTKDGKVYTYAPTPDITSNSTEIVTTEWLTNWIEKNGAKDYPDEITIHRKEDDKLEAIGLVNKNPSGATIFNWIGTLAQWQEGRNNKTIPDNWICYITDDGVDYTNN